VLGPNGAGKTTLARIASAQLPPSAGDAFVLGQRLGRVGLAQLRREIGLVEPTFARRFYAEQRAIDVVLSGLSGSILLVDEIGSAKVQLARSALETVSAAGLESRLFASCSEGERARILLARALVVRGPLLVLDEPTARLDVVGRLLLEQALERAIDERPDLASITVTHELESLPLRTTHALLLREGAVVSSGPFETALDPESLAACFLLPLEIATAYAARRPVGLRAQS